MKIATNNQTIDWPHLRPDNTIKTRKSETMFLKILRKFFWMDKPNHSHSIQHLSDHLKRDMGIIEQDFNPKPRSNDRHPTPIRPNQWL